MKNIFKVAVVAIAMTMAAFTANAQTAKGDMAGGVKLAWLEGDGYSPMGLGVKFQYNVIDNLRLEPSFTFFMPKKVLGISMNAMDLSANAHYLFRVGQKVNLYPLAGLGLKIARAGVNGVSVSDSVFALNIGGGADFFLTDKSFLNAEIKAMVGDGSSMILSAGYGFMF